ncbi:MAG: response regulator [Gammaproteobacteria bacterium]|nr:response regulator [Gammaproteobacteria bacterium]MCH9744003.1 response regulator [Gammaproteobacteria bacterium]
MTEDKKIAQLERQLAKAQSEIEYLHAVVDNLPGSVYWKDTAGVYLGNNTFAQEIIAENDGITVSIVGKTDYDLFDEHDAKIFRDSDREVMTTGKVVRAVEETQNQSGESVTQLSIKKPLYNSDKEIIGVVGNTVDISEQKKVESALRDAKGQLEVANNIKNEFIANMTHDIRTPLAAIQSLSEDILLHSDSGLVKKNATYLLRSGQQLLNYFERIFEVLCLETNKEKKNKTCFRLYDSVRAVLDIVMINANKKNISLESKYDTGLPEYIKSYDTYIQRIMLNLMINAIKFTDQGGVNLNVNLHSVEPERIWVDLVVSDTGIGISDEVKKIIYDKFSRGTSSYGGQHRGAGVGLYIVKNLVEEMGGTIELKSRLHGGSTFICRLPLELVSEGEIEEVVDKIVDNDKAAEEIDDEITYEKQYFQSSYSEESEAHTRVLLVEDNKIAQYAETSKLKRLNCHVDVAVDAGHALKFLRSNQYHLVMCDVGLPDMDGYQLVKLIKKDFSEKVHDIVLLTAHVDREIDKSVSKLISGIYKKPLLLEDAKNILERARGETNIQH